MDFTTQPEAHTAVIESAISAAPSEGTTDCTGGSEKAKGRPYKAGRLREMWERLFSRHWRTPTPSSSCSQQETKVPVEAVTQDLPMLDPHIVYQISGAVGYGLRVIPVAEQGGRVVLVCEKPLTPEQRQTLSYMTSRDSFDLVDDPSQYVEIRRHFDALLHRYFPPANACALASPDVKMRGRSR